MQPALRLTVLVALVLGAAAVLDASATLMLAPAVLLALPLLLGRYPGERLIHHLARREGPRLAARCAPVPRAPRSLGARVAALAAPGSGRAPPAGALI
jgi:hypothetical protein